MFVMNRNSIISNGNDVNLASAATQVSGAGNRNCRAPILDSTSSVGVQEALDQITEATKSVVAWRGFLIPGEQTGDRGRCARFHKQQGSTSCRFCHGLGFERAMKALQGETLQKNHSSCFLAKTPRNERNAHL